ncbi:hypothetical protein [Pseudogemmobacter blasticus]|uniref:hypothetical protein n=1 Tax=Fuscovulum blasticum TaxID=1075 RepID=UPI0011B1E7E6|nr:hypothetical protein [Fuscovulum blasticum]
MVSGQRLTKAALCLAGGAALLIAGYVLGALVPPWHGAPCHALGGALEILPGPGKPTACVIPWDRH